MFILALESSTSSAKALVYEMGRGVVARASSAYPAWKACGEQDADEVYDAVLRVGREAAAGRDIAAIALAGTYHSIGVFDGDFAPVGPIYTWEYPKSAELCKRMRQDEALAGELYERTGCVPNVTYPRQALLYLKEKGFSFARRRLMSQSAYNYYRMTGEFVETRCTASGGGLLNLKTREYDELTLALIGIEPSQLGRLAGYEYAAELTDGAAKALGVRGGIPVVAPYPDGALSQIGSGAADAGRMTLSVGTSAAIRLTSAEPVLPPSRKTWCYMGVDGYLCGAATNGACNCVNWFKDTLLGGRVSFDELEAGEREMDSPPVFLPFLFGERCPGWRDDRRGGFFDLDAGHTPSDMYRAVQAGILFNLYQCYEALVSVAEEPYEIIVSGGILNSKRWTQMVADVFDREVRPCRDNDASLMGAAALALHAVGALDDITKFDSGYAAEPIASDPSRTECMRKEYERYIDWYVRT